MEPHELTGVCETHVEELPKEEPQRSFMKHPYMELQQKHPKFHPKWAM